MVRPAATTTYTLTAVQGAFTVSQDVVVTVQAGTLFLLAPALDGARVVINGVDTAPMSVPPRWTWGDGTETSSWFPASHTYLQSGNYRVTVKTTYVAGGGDQVSLQVNNVVAPPAFTLDFEPRTLAATSGTTASVTVRASRLNGHADAIHLALDPAPFGIAGSGEIPAGSDTGTLTVQVAPTLAGRVIGLPILGTGGAASARALLPLSVPPQQAQDWQWIGPRQVPKQTPGQLSCGKLQAFAVHPTDPDRMYAAGGIGPGNSGPYSATGIYRSLDGGAHWEAASSGLADLTVGSLWLDPLHPEVLLASTWDGGLFRSTNGGQSWTRVRAGRATALFHVGETVYAGCQDGVAASTDGGATWQLWLSSSSPVMAMGWGAGAFYVGLDDGRILYRPVASSSWQTVMGPAANRWIWDIAVNPSDPRHALVTINTAGVLSNHVTRDGGNSWNVWSANPSGSEPILKYAQVVAFDTVDPRIIYAGFNCQFFVSHDSGSTWTRRDLSVDARLLRTMPGQAGSVVVGSDHGLYLSRDYGNTWRSLNGDLEGTLVYDVAASGSTIFCTMQDFSPIYSYDGGASWLHNNSGAPSVECGTVMVHPADSRYFFMQTLAGFWRSEDTGRTWGLVPSFPADGFAFTGAYERIATDPRDPARLYVLARQGVYRSGDYGATLTKTTWPFSDPSLVAVNPNGWIYVGTPPWSTSNATRHTGTIGHARRPKSSRTSSNPGHVLRTGQWHSDQPGGTARRSPLKGPFGQAMAIPASLQAADSGRLYISRDQGVTWNPVGLPGGAVWQSPTTLAVHSGNPMQVFLGMSGDPGTAGGGVLRSLDGGLTFAPFNQGLPIRAPGLPFGSPYACALRFYDASTVFLSTTNGVFMSRNGGAWVDITGNAPARVFQGMAIRDGWLYVGTFGHGVLRKQISRILEAP